MLFPVQIVVLWNCDKPLPPRNKWPSTSVPLTVTEGQTKVRAAAFFFLHLIKSREATIHSGCTGLFLLVPPAGVHQDFYAPPFGF